MRIALLGDLHGNMIAVEAVDADIKARHIDAIYCLGDLVGKGPCSPETMDWAFARCDVILKGNWDEALSKDGVNIFGKAWYRKQLGVHRLRLLSELPMEHRLLFAGRRVRLLHGRPIVSCAVYSDSEMEQRLLFFQTPDGYAPQIVGFADIHRPFYEQIVNAGTLFNTGSVGNPLGQHPYASYVILEGDMGGELSTLTHTIVQVAYNREIAIQQAQAVRNLPALDSFVNELTTGLYSRKRTRSKGIVR